MAGKPMKKMRFFEALTMAADDYGKTPEDFVFDHVAGGGEMSRLADLIGYDRSYVSRILNADKTFSVILDKARRAAADVRAEETQSLADELAGRLDRGEEVSSERVAVLREQIRSRQWLASMQNPDKYSPKQQAVTINLGDLHLDALRAARSAPPPMVDVTPEDGSDE